MKLITRVLLLLGLLIVGGCSEKEQKFPDFSAIGKINVIQDVKESTKATLRLFTTKKYQKIKVSKIDSPESFEWSISEPKTVIVKNQKQKLQSYYYTITISFSGPAHFSKIELSLDGETKTYNIGRFECKEMLYLEDETSADIKVYFDFPFEGYQDVFLCNPYVPVIIYNDSEHPIRLLSITSLAQNDEYQVDLLKSNLLSYQLKPMEMIEATTLYIELYTDNLMQLDTLFELNFVLEGVFHKKTVKCSLGMISEVIDSEVLSISVDLDYLNEGKACSLEEELLNDN